MKQNKRVTGKEQYYTPEKTVIECISLLDKVHQGDTYLEPAGGTGAFIEQLIQLNRNVVSYDIEPKHNLVQQTEDFLLEDLSHLSDIITISNPPFGRANKLCVPFFNKCAEVSTHIGFLIPKSWRKWSVINRLDNRFHLVSDTELTVDFIHPSQEKKSKGKLNTIFQVWEKRDELRETISVMDRNYITKTNPDDADVSLTVFGRGCGKLKEEFPRVPNTTQMFLKCNEPWVVDALKTVDFSRFYSNVAFVEALSIKEINFLLNEYKDAGN